VGIPAACSSSKRASRTNSRKHGAAERLSQPRRVMGGPCDERSVASKAAVGDEQVQVRMPVGPRAVRLQARDDADGELALTRARRMAAVTVRAATRAISPSRRRR